MAELTTIARPYAKAAFQYAQDKGEAGKWAESLLLLAAVVSEPRMAAYLAQPQLRAEQQTDALISVCGDTLVAGCKNFILQLVENKRLFALPQIAHLFNAYLRELEKTEQVEVTSAFALSSEEEQKIIDSMKKRLGKQVKLNAQVDTSLIGGVVIRAGDLVIDSSIRGKLAKLAETLNS